MTVPVSTRPQWWQWATVLSLDAPAVVIVWQWLLAELAGVRIGWPEVMVVGCSVWLSYAADRWVEARRLPPAQILTTRHRFYHDHARAVAIVWAVVFAADLAVALLMLTRRELVAGIILLTPTLLYVLSHQGAHREHAARLPKEICVALLIAGGSSVFVLAAPAIIWSRMLPQVVLFATLCFSNVALISAWEEDVDETHGQASLARQFRYGAALSHALPFIVTAVAAFAAVPFLGVPPVAAHCIAASGILLALVDRFEPMLGWRLARVLADLVLLTPLIPLLRERA